MKLCHREKKEKDREVKLKIEIECRMIQKIKRRNVIEKKLEKIKIINRMLKNNRIGVVQKKIKKQKIKKDEFWM